MISLPAGQYAWLLLALLPGVWLLAKRLLARMDRAHAALLAPVLAIVLLSLSTHIASLVTHSIYRGFPIAAIALGLSGYVANLPRFAGKKDLSPNRAETLPASYWIILILTTVFIARPIFAYSFYESATVPGHESTPAAMLNGYYPPVYLAQPTLELRYHYGFDVMVAVTEMLLRIRVDQANDLLTLACWMMLIGALWSLGEILIGRGAGSFCALIVPFAGGLTFFGELAQRRTLWTGPFRVGGVPMLFPFSLNFFQKPWAVGLPAWCLAIVLIISCVRAPRRNLSPLIALAATVCGLALLEAVLFASLVGAGGICLLANYFHKRNPRVLETGLAVALGALFATQLHGFFAVGEIRGSDPLIGFRLIGSLSTGGIAGGLGKSLAWNFLSFCLLVPLGFLGLRRTKSLGILTANALAALIICNCFRYPFTNDINKFASLAAIPLAIGAAAILHKWWNQSRRAFPRACLILLIGVISLQGIMFVGGHWIGRGLEIRQPIHPYMSFNYPIDPDDAAAISWLRNQVRPPENIYCRRENNLALQYARWGGLPIIWSQDWDSAFGMSADIQKHRISLAEQSDRISQIVQPQLRAAAAIDFLSRLKTEGVKWVVVHQEDDWLLPALIELKSQGKVKLAGEFGKIQIYRVF